MRAAIAMVCQTEEPQINPGWRCSNTAQRSSRCNCPRLTQSQQRRRSRWKSARRHRWPASTILAARRQLSWPVEVGEFWIVSAVFLGCLESPFQRLFGKRSASGRRLQFGERWAGQTRRRGDESDPISEHERARSVCIPERHAQPVAFAASPAAHCRCHRLSLNHVRRRRSIWACQTLTDSPRNVG